MVLSTLVKPKQDVLNKPGTSDEVAEQLLAAVSAMSKTDAGRQSIFTGHSIPVLVKMLGNSNKKIVEYALGTLHNLEQYMTAEVVEPIRLAGGVSKMTEVFVERRASPNKPWSNKFVAMLLNSIEILCTGDIGSKSIFEQKQGLPTLIATMNTVATSQKPYEKLAYTSIRLFCVLSAFNTIKEKIIAEGGMEAANALQAADLKSNSEKVNERALWAVRNLSDKGNWIDQTRSSLD